MYEEVAYEQILKKMMDRIPADVDKREGSLIYNALAPAAVEMQNLYIQMSWLFDQMFADTANREHLIRRAAERGITPQPAACAVLKGEFNQEIPIGSRFSLDGLNYEAVKRMGMGQYQMKCETIGTAGNKAFGSLIPIQYIKGLTKAELTELLIPGEDEEETEALRNRYFRSLDSQAFGGNEADYKEKVNALAGVGGVKVFRAWNGGGTVRLVLLGSDYQAPSPELLKAVKEAMDPEETSGEGYGLAPIGHRVTVEGVEAVAIHVRTAVTYAPGAGWETIQEAAENAVADYLASLRKEWEKGRGLTVRISRIEMALLDLEGVVDLAGTAINGAASNLTLGSCQIPVKGDVNGT